MVYERIERSEIGLTLLRTQRWMFLKSDRAGGDSSPCLCLTLLVLVLFSLQSDSQSTSSETNQKVITLPYLSS